MAKELTSMRIGDLNTGLISQLHSGFSNGYWALISHEENEYEIDATPIKSIPCSGKYLIALTGKDSQRCEFNSEFMEALETTIRKGSTFYTKGREGANPGNIFKWTAKKVKKSK